jgi:hypothetical protein
MRPNLSFENLAAVLAALGTTAIVACGGATPQPVQANEVKPAANAPAGNASCSAKGCGASPATAAASPATPAATTATSPATEAASATMPAASAVRDTATPPASTTTTTTTVTTPTTAAVSKKQGPRASTAQAPKKKPGASGEASCGAGTCSGSATPKVR